MTDIAEPPQAQPERISRLIARLESGDIKVPKFQRGFVWTREQVLALLDSIYRGFPISSVLLWRTHSRLADDRNIGSFSLPPTQEAYPTNYILDGQQRLTSIYGALSTAAGNVDANFRVFRDLRTGLFFHADGPTEPFHMRLGFIFEPARLRQFQTSLQNSGLDDAEGLLLESDRVSETFREYSVPLITVSLDSTEDVASIFERINSTGTKLTVFDLMVAATWTEDFDLNDHVSQIKAELEQKSFESVDKVTILRILTTLAHDSATRDKMVSLRERSREDLTRDMARTKEAIRRAIDFLSTDLRISSDDFLPYERQLVLLSYVQSKRNLSGTDSATLRRWFWRTCFSERYRRGGEGLFDADLLVVLSTEVGDRPG